MLPCHSPAVRWILILDLLETEWTLYFVFLWPTEHDRNDNVPLEASISPGLQFAFPVESESTGRRAGSLERTSVRSPSHVETLEGTSLRRGREKSVEGLELQIREFSGSWASVLVTLADTNFMGQHQATLSHSSWESVFKWSLGALCYTAQNEYFEGRRCCCEKRLKQMVVSLGLSF